MLKRSALFVLVGLCLALLIVGTVTGIAARGRTNPSTLLRLHTHSPVLLLVDSCALFIFFGVSIFGALYLRMAEDQKTQTSEQSRQLAIMMERTAELARINDEYSDQIGAMESAARTRQAEFDAEMRRFVEQSFYALTGQVDAQTRQLEAVSMALQYQHAEILDVSQAVKAMRGIETFENAGLLSAKKADTADLEPRGEEQPVIQPTAEAKQFEPAIMPRIPSIVLDVTRNDQVTQVVGTLDFDVVCSQPVSLDSDVRDGAGSERGYAEKIVENKAENSNTMDTAEIALSTLMIEAQEALSSLRAQVEAASEESEALSNSHRTTLMSQNSEPPAKQGRWHIKF